MFNGGLCEFQAIYAVAIFLETVFNLLGNKNCF